MVDFSVSICDDEHELAVVLALPDLLEDARPFSGVRSDTSILPCRDTAGNVRESRILIQIHETGAVSFGILSREDKAVAVSDNSCVVTESGFADNRHSVHAGFPAEAAAVGCQSTAQAVGVVDPASFRVFSDLGKSRRTCLVESKYLAGTSVSKISDNIHPIAGLRDAEILAVKHLPCDIVPQFIQRVEDCLKRPARVMR